MKSFSDVIRDLSGQLVEIYYWVGFCESYISYVFLKFLEQKSGLTDNTYT